VTSRSVQALPYHGEPELAVATDRVAPYRSGLVDAFESSASTFMRSPSAQRFGRKGGAAAAGLHNRLLLRELDGLLVPRASCTSFALVGVGMFVLGLEGLSSA